jgi:hypothetical protein
MLLSSFAEDPEKQQNGTPIYVGDATFFCRRYGTPESKRALKELLMGHWLTEYGVVGWENVFTEEARQLKYSKKDARNIFTNPEYFLSLNTILMRDISNFENFLYDAAEEDIEALKKN